VYTDESNDTYWVTVTEAHVDFADEPHFRAIADGGSSGLYSIRDEWPGAGGHSSHPDTKPQGEAVSDSSRDALAYQLFRHASERDEARRERDEALVLAVEAIERVEERWHRMRHFANPGEALNAARDEVLAIVAARGEG